jgi:hypothetical protein
MQPPPRAEESHIFDFQFQHKVRYESTLDMTLFQVLNVLPMLFVRTGGWQIIEQIRIAKVNVFLVVQLLQPKMASQREPYAEGAHKFVCE